MENNKETVLYEEQKEYGEPEISAVHYGEDVISTSDPWETEIL